MAAALEGLPVSYEDLADIEMEFEEVELEILRQQATLTSPLYTRRSATTSKIPTFWPLVFEQCPPDIDQYIQPSDSNLIMNHLTNFSVSRFEVDPSYTSANAGTNGSAKMTGKGDPRSVAIRFEFSENSHFSNSVLEKKFWHRRSKDGESGLVSEPVKIDWKSDDKDLTGGLLDMVIKNYETQKAANGKGKEEKKATPEQQALMNKIENTGMGGLSFFAWFGFIGRRVTAEESAEAYAKLNKAREDRKKGIKAEKEEEKEEIEDEEEMDAEELDLSLEIFPDGDNLAVALSDDLWANALNYFTQAQEQDAMSDLDFESDDGEDIDINQLLGKHAADSDVEGGKSKKSRTE